LQLLDTRYSRIVESVDILPRQRATSTGRHLVVGGGTHVQVVDGLPFTSTAAVPASALRSASPPR
jgi:hypothetical protein